MNNLEKAAKAAGFNQSDVDFQTLVGVFLTLQKWVSVAPDLRAQGKKTMIDDWRASGEKHLRVELAKTISEETT